MTVNRLYDDLAHLWPWVSPPEDYAKEALIWRDLLREKLGAGRHEILELGVGGGHNLSHLTGDFQATAVDLSQPMIEHSVKLNSGVKHHIGDMRSVRLGKTFSAVIIHDAISYMVSEEDLRRTFQTAAAHLKKGGVFLTAPDYVTETFQDSRVHHRTVRKGDMELTRLEYEFDPDPADTTYELLMFLLMRKKGASPIIEQDHHVLGLFPVPTWRGLLEEAGFNVEVRRREVEEGAYQIHFFVGVLR